MVGPPESRPRRSRAGGRRRRRPGPCKWGLGGLGPFAGITERGDRLCRRDGPDHSWAIEREVVMKKKTGATRAGAEAKAKEVPRSRRYPEEEKSPPPNGGHGELPRTAPAQRAGAVERRGSSRPRSGGNSSARWEGWSTPLSCPLFPPPRPCPPSFPGELHCVDPRRCTPALNTIRRSAARRPR